MDKMLPETVRLMHPGHSTNVSIVSEMLVRIKNYLDTH